MAGQPQGGAAARHEKDDPQGRKPERPKSRKDLDKELDKALEDSFPASDPPAPSQPTGTEPAGDPNRRR
jgi:hypothetical protein